MPIQVSREAIGFGELKPGQEAKATLIVSGGPGRVKVGSDMVTVQPETFGLDETVLTVTVKGGLNGQVLWNALILESEGDSVKVDITARWQMPLPTVPQKLVVPYNGDLERALEKVTDGGTIRLEEGEFPLSRPLTVNKSVRLQGAGMDKTRIVCESEGYVVRFVGEGLFAVSDLTFEHRGSKWARVVQVESGKVESRRCRFMGGVWDEAAAQGGSGLRLIGRTKGIVLECEFIQNGLFGIMVEGEAQPTLEGNTCEENKWSGIAYFGSACGTASKNTCQNNGSNGIYVGEQAQPTLSKNTCEGNKLGDIVDRRRKG